ncbi:MAG: Fur family transcriptional regulator [Rhodospirillales bacterium]|nr:Fur family transcriptional regulator [Rhodospirillales bacterium]MDP6883769.1 Fur family transcriptional regulator [Rhodospirillales bacterium]
MARAVALCRRRGARLTAIRRRVLEVVWQGHRPLGAYEILETLRADHAGAAPPTVYRALEFLLGHGLVHRIESLNAFVGCSEPGPSHGGQFLLCRTCGTAAELNDPRIVLAIEDSALESGFHVHHPTIEVSGLCPNCRPSDAAEPND